MFYLIPPITNLAQIDQALFNTIFIAVVGAVLTFSFGVVLFFMNRRSTRRENALNRQHENERQATELRHEDERLALAARVAEAKEMAGRMNEAETKLRVFEAQASPINALFTRLLAREMTHFHTPVLDALLAKAVSDPPTITLAEIEQITVATQQRMKDMGPKIGDDERDAAEMFPAQLRRKVREAERIAAGAKLSEIHVVGTLPNGE